MKDGIVPALLVNQFMCGERREILEPEWFTATRTCNRVALTVPVWSLPLCLVLYLVCPRNAIFLQPPKNTASHKCFCLQPSSQVVVWNSVLCEQFNEQAVICTIKDGLWLVTSYPEKVGKLISYYHMYGKLENSYPEKQPGQWLKTHGVGWCKEKECWII